MVQNWKSKQNCSPNFHMTFTAFLWFLFVVHFTQKVEFELSYSPFFWDPKNRVKGGVPVYLFEPAGVSKYILIDADCRLP